MSYKCDLTNKKSTIGNSKSHSMNSNKRRFYPNIHKKKIWIPNKNKFIKLKLSSKGIRLINKFGIENILNKLKIKY